MGERLEISSIWLSEITTRLHNNNIELNLINQHAGEERKEEIEEQKL